MDGVKNVRTDIIGVGWNVEKFPKFVTNMMKPMEIAYPVSKGWF